MFESLSDKLGGVLNSLSKKGRLTDKDIDEALRAVRLALLEADVDFKVVRQFVKNVKEKAVGDDVFGSLTPGQSVVRIVQSELTSILGGETEELARSDRRPASNSVGRRSRITSRRSTPLNPIPSWKRSRRPIRACAP